MQFLLSIKISYLTLVYHVKSFMWSWWHMELPNKFGNRMHWLMNSRPWWHMCCNGDRGGWRTDFCDWLEGYPNGWRALEERLDLYPEEEEE